MLMMFDPLYLVIFIVFTVAGLVVSNKLKSKFKRYSQVPVASGMSGKEVAEKMLRDNNIYDVQVVSVPGKLTDHYNPTNKTVNLSPDVYNGRSVAAAAVAAHECGHAVQHATAYSFLELRSMLVPAVSFSSRIMNFVMIAGLIFAGATSLLSWNNLLLVIIILQTVITVFTFVTLPVEFNASQRALVWLKSSGGTVGMEYGKAKDALNWAAMTYLVAALAAMATLLYFVMQYMGGDD